MKEIEKVMKILSSNCRNKKLQCYDRWKKFCWSNRKRTYDNITKIATSQGDNYTTRWLLDYPYFEKYYKLIAIELSKQRKIDADPKAKQQVNFTGNLNRAEGATMFFIIEEAKETVLDFSKGTVKVLTFYLVLI